jgi:hypothetical protein
MNKFRNTSSALAVAMAVATLSQSAFGHTRLQIPTVTEGSRVYNNVVIGHGCGTLPVVGTSVVFPDGVSSTMTVAGAAHDGVLTDFVSNWGPSISVIQSNTLFSESGVKKSSTGNTVGFWAGAGKVLATDMIGMVPFRVNAVNFEPSSCATSVRFFVSIVDICEVTDIDHLQSVGDHGSDSPVGLWTHHDLGTQYDAASSGGPASLTITRNLTTNPLPASCGSGVSVDVKSSAEQINRDMPIVVDGVQAWPLP